MQIEKQLVKTKYSDKWGLQLTQFKCPTRKYLIMVQKVHTKSVAAKAGIQVGWIILSLNGYNVIGLQIDKVMERLQSIMQVRC